MGTRGPQNFMTPATEKWGSSTVQRQEECPSRCYEHEQYELYNHSSSQEVRHYKLCDIVPKLFQVTWSPSPTPPKHVMFTLVLKQHYWSDAIECLMVHGLDRQKYIFV